MVTKMPSDRETALDELTIAVAETTLDAWLDSETEDEQSDEDGVQGRPPV
jgi:hypothetical protein